MSPNTLFLRLAGPMQSWGTSSRFQLRRTDTYPSKSGVLGMLLCAMGVRRKDSLGALEPLTQLLMGVRVDRGGTSDWDYHTAGAGIGIRSADGKIKKTASTGEYETLLSRRQYLYDASFLVALHGLPETIKLCKSALENPIWPIFLGRKCCIPGEPVFVGADDFETVASALTSVPWQARIQALENPDQARRRTLETYIEHRPGTPPPQGARLVYDVPREFGFNNQGPRWVVQDSVTVSVGAATHVFGRTTEPYHDPYGEEWDDLRRRRLAIDNDLCVFCKSPAAQVHHLDYADVRPETLRSLCKICHDACTMLEYGHDMRARRIDPADSEQHPIILRQIKKNIAERRLGRRRELLEAGRKVEMDFFDELPKSWTKEDR